MAIIVEDGTGKVDAVSYLSVADADTHHTARGNTQWTALTTTQKEQALVRATDYIDKRFGRKFRGSKIGNTQALEWPRSGATDNDGFSLGSASIPAQLKKATAEYAMRAYLVNVLAPDVPATVPSQSFITGATSGTAPAPSGEIKRVRVEAGPVVSEKEYQSAGSFESFSKSTLVSGRFIPEYPEADMWMEELIKSGMSIPMYRA